MFQTPCCMHILVSLNIVAGFVTEGNSGLQTTSSCGNENLFISTLHLYLNGIVTAAL